MYAASRLSRVAPFFSRIAVWSAVLSCAPLATQAELLIEHERGGLDRYIGTAGPLAVGFTLFEPTRIEAVTGWMSAADQITVSLSWNEPRYPSYGAFSETFTGSFEFGLPGKWQGVSGLKWDLPPGTYFITFSDGYFPIAYGGPPSSAPQGFEAVQYYYPWDSANGQWDNLGFPIGVRVYGNLLSAVPEPSTYGAWAGVALVGLTVLRRRAARLARR